MSMRRLRWWQRGRRRPAVAGGPAAGSAPPVPDAARTPVPVGAPYAAPVDQPGSELTVPDLAAEPAPPWRLRSVVGTRPPAASYPGRWPLGSPIRPEGTNADAGDDGAASATMPIPVPEADRPRSGGLP